MKKIEKIAHMDMHRLTAPMGQQGVGLVPTMGALHEGHLSLIQAAKQACQEVGVSIFVNPTQFSPGEDFERYPRPIEADLAKCEAEGVDWVFCPSVEEMYPTGCVTRVQVDRLGDVLCGQHRPGHFEGVATVVAKLFNIVQPAMAFFGQKDAQQVAIIRRMVRDLCSPVKIAVCPTIREADGLAMSSRNVYLSSSERAQATVLFESLSWAKSEIESGQKDVAGLTREMRNKVIAAGPCEIDYIEIVDADELTPKSNVEGRCLIALAVRIGKARLIDNLVVDAPRHGS